MKLLIGIPAYNEESTIVRVVKSLPKKLKSIDKIDILVIDDGSNDGTGYKASLAGANVISHLINRGLGGALKTLFIFARDNKYDILVTFDADGQHDARFIEKLVSPIIKEKYDVVIGSRWINVHKAPFTRLLINRIANLLTFTLFGINTTDSQSGFRAFNTDAINKINLTSDGMEVSSEVFREIYLKHLRYTEVPIKAIYTNYSLKKGQPLHNAPSIFFQLMLRYLR